MWYECDSRFIAAHDQPAGLIDLALSRGIDSHRLLRGCGLFYEDIASGQALISPQQYLQLIANAQRLLGDDDLSFLYGQRLLPGHYGEASLALQRSADLLQALEHLCASHALLSPLLRPSLLLDEQNLYLYWLDSCGAGPQRRFLLEACQTSVLALSRQLSGQRLPWRLQFAHAEPAHVEQYWVHLGEEVRFSSQLTLMSLPRQYLHQPCPGASPTAQQVSAQRCRQHLEQLGWRDSFLDCLYDHLQEHIRQPLNLERVAATFGMSPASFKRKLQKHGSHFQEQLDRVRKHRALYLYQIKGYTNEEVAQHLCFNDTTNLRRSFKRWTGLAPSGLGRGFG
ncbi:AraC family transcriptional regulator [Stutzerimonas kirkiae]|uniref:AraC family transcriptional regulator n=1 Tax=Stutzerimonas kirkiae TaxID=2211392 RepID=UPI0010385BF9|nr:AraC family transcriptional regulator [Stutzerimonas kirkiae]TBV10941.1 AraC family transcriptional regulator [Stutzerimonas kirkiae]